MDRKSVVASHCDASKQCDPEGLDAASTGKALTIISTIAFGIGAVGFGAFIFLPTRTAPSTTAGIRLTGTF